MLAAEFGGQIHASTDAGANWVTINPDRQNWSTIVCSADGGKLAAAVLGGGIYTSVVTPAPQLKLSPAGKQLAISWLMPSGSFVLQENHDLTTSNWVTLPNVTTFNLMNLHNQVSLAPSNRSSFYRLSSP